MVTQAESDFSIDLVPEPVRETVPDPVAEPAVFINTSQSNYSYLQDSSVTGHRGLSEPKMTGPRPGSKRKHVTEASTIILRHGLFLLTAIS